MNINIQSHVESNNTFALDLYTKLNVNNDNLCVSPFSIFMALAMTFAGARRTTEKQMARVMYIATKQHEFHEGFSKLLKQINVIGQDNSIELLMANSLYPHSKHSFLKSFVDCLQEDYETVITPLDYNEPENARKFINQWVNEETKEHISELIPPGTIDTLTRLVLVNAIYFKGLWAKQFDKQGTMNSPFWVSNEEFVNVPMMRQKSGFKHSEDDLVQVLELPYQGKNLSLIIILPRERDGLVKVEGALSFKKLSSWSNNMYKETVDIHLPVFKIKSTFDLNNVLIAMGMLDAFDINKADFSGMDGMKYPDGLYIKHTFHQADIEVNEEGTTATAATAVVMALRGLPQEYQLHADHPFIFLLRENSTNTILFIGRVQNPLE